MGDWVNRNDNATVTKLTNSIGHDTFAKQFFAETTLANKKS